MARRQEERERALVIVVADQRQQQECGLEHGTIDLLRQFSFHDAKGGKYDMAECSVCMEGFREGEKIRELPICGHVFHQKCVDEWLSLRPSCPICRMNTAVALETEKRKREAEIFGKVEGKGEAPGPAEEAREAAPEEEDVPVIRVTLNDNILTLERSR